jgi:Tetratricopeptide repeat
MMISIQQILEQATIVRRTGRLKEAAGLCRRILAIKPDHANSLHLLGAIAHDTGQTERAVDLIGQAIAIDNQSADFQSNTLEEGKRARRSALRTVSAVSRGGALLRISFSFSDPEQPAKKEQKRRATAHSCSLRSNTSCHPTLCNDPSFTPRVGPRRGQTQRPPRGADVVSYACFAGPLCIYFRFYECRRIVTTHPFTECFREPSAWGVCHV